MRTCVDKNGGEGGSLQNKFLVILSLLQIEVTVLNIYI